MKVNSLLVLWLRYFEQSLVSIVMRQDYDNLSIKHQNAVKIWLFRSVTCL